MKTMKAPDFSTANQRKIGFEYPAVYSIRVLGCLEKSWSKRLSGLNIFTYTSGLTHGIEMTSLTGELIDQAALMGVLNALYNLRLTIWSVECLGAPMK
jgi:hypothetical protein